MFMAFYFLTFILIYPRHFIILIIDFKYSLNSSIDQINVLNYKNY